MGTVIPLPTSASRTWATFHQSRPLLSSQTLYHPWTRSTISQMPSGSPLAGLTQALCQLGLGWNIHTWKGFFCLENQIFYLLSMLFSSLYMNLSTFHQILGTWRRFHFWPALCQGRLLRVPRGGQRCPWCHRSQMQTQGRGGLEDGRDAHDAQGRLANHLRHVQVSS